MNKTKYLDCTGTVVRSMNSIKIMLQMVRKKMQPKMTQDELAAEIRKKLEQRELELGVQGTRIGMVTGQKISDWETMRLRGDIPEDVLECWLEVLGLDKDRDCNMIKLPNIPVRALDYTMVKFAIGFVEYMNDSVRGENNDSVKEYSSFLEATRDFENHVLDYLQRIRSEYEADFEENHNTKIK